MASIKLVVVEAFDDYRRGDEINDDKIIGKIINGPKKDKVRKINAATTKKED